MASMVDLLLRPVAALTLRAGHLLALVILALVSAGGAFAQGSDDSYKGPPPPSSFGQQIQDRGLQAPPGAAQPGGAPAAPSGGGLVGGGGAGGGEGLRGTQRQGTVAPIPIAIPPFVGDDPKLAGDLALVVASDLERSGLFQPIDPASYLEQISDINALPRFPDWRQIRSEALVVGRVHAGRGWPCHHRVPALGRDERQAARGPKVHDVGPELAPARAYGGRSGL